MRRGVCVPIKCRQIVGGIHDSLTSELQKPFVGCSLTSFKPTDFFRPVVGRINV